MVVVAVKASGQQLRIRLDSTTLAQPTGGDFNQLVTDLTTDGDAWANH